MKKLQNPVVTYAIGMLVAIVMMCIMHGVVRAGAEEQNVNEPVEEAIQMLEERIRQRKAKEPIHDEIKKLEDEAFWGRMMFPWQYTPDAIIIE